MQRRWLIRVGKARLVTVLLVAVISLGWAVFRSYRSAWPDPQGITLPRPGFEREEAIRVARAHGWWRVIRGVERKMDSLKQDSAGVHIYERILERRPGLMDSLRHAEEYFFNEIKRER